MRALIAGLASITVMVMPVPMQAQDEAALARTFDEYVHEYNDGDARAVAAFYDTDAVRNFGDDIVIGREQIQRRIAENFAGRPKDTTLTLLRDRVRFLTPDVAVVHGTFEFAVGVAPPIKGHFQRTMIKREGMWLIAALQTFSYRQPPADEPSA